MILIEHDMSCNVHAIKADADDSVSVLVWGVVTTWEALSAAAGVCDRAVAQGTRG